MAGDARKPSGFIDINNRVPRLILQGNAPQVAWCRFLTDDFLSGKKSITGYGVSLSNSVLWAALRRGYHGEFNHGDMHSQTQSQVRDFGLPRKFCSLDFPLEPRCQTAWNSKFRPRLSTSFAFFLFQTFPIHPYDFHLTGIWPRRRGAALPLTLIYESAAGIFSDNGDLYFG